MPAPAGYRTVPTPRPTDISVCAAAGAGSVITAASSAGIPRCTAPKLWGAGTDRYGRQKNVGAQSAAPLRSPRNSPLVTAGAGWSTDPAYGPVSPAWLVEPAPWARRRAQGWRAWRASPVSRRWGCASGPRAAGARPRGGASPGGRLPGNAAPPWPCPGRTRARWESAAPAPPTVWAPRIRLRGRRAYESWSSPYVVKSVTGSNDRVAHSRDNRTARARLRVISPSQAATEVLAVSPKRAALSQTYANVSATTSSARPGSITMP